MIKANKFNIADKVMFMGDIAIVKDYIFHALEQKYEYLIQVSDNKPELVQENELHKYSDLISLGLQQYLKAVLKPFKYNSERDYAYATGTKYLNICLHEYGDLTLFITMDDLEKLEYFRNYSLESLGL